MLTPDYTNKIIHSDASISDMVAFHDALRDIEASTLGILAPVIHTYKEVPIGGGSIFPAVAFINGWTFQFPAGSWYISGGNFAATINPVSGCYVERLQSAAYAVSSSLGGSTGPTPEEVASAVWSANASLTLINEATKARQMQTNKAIISGDGLSVSIYDDTGTTLLHTFSISEDKNTRTPV